MQFPPKIDAFEELTYKVIIRSEYIYDPPIRNLPKIRLDVYYSIISFYEKSA